ncbi:endonuclease/exonuclease/phosphatase family protein [Streptomyces sp. NPDC004065]|uniref:endonuclease/exonuclease/phosphatase family protein n=1 Tax=Streptomyces sp. NPDC004065 TaxID=3364689 RepID=UPI00384AA008
MTGSVPPRAPSVPAVPAGRVRCATFNVLHGLRLLEDGRAPGTEDAAGPAPLAEAVAALDADVLALQEVDRLQPRSGGVDQAAVAAAAMGAGHWRYASALHARALPGGGWVRDPAAPGLREYGPRSRNSPDGVPSHGIALLSRLPVRAWRARRLAAAPLAVPLRSAGRPGLTAVRDQPRAVLAAVLEGPAGPFTAVAVHLSFVPGWNVGQLLAVRRWIADLPRPCLLLGDFNLVGAVPRATLNAAERVRSRLPGAAPGRRGDAWRETARTPTYPSHRPLVQFDHVLASGIGADAVAGACAPRTAISDHRPLVADLALTRCAPCTPAAPARPTTG